MSLSINGDVSFPKPVNEPPKRGETYYYPNIIRTSLAGCNEWLGDEVDLKLFESNMVHLTEENAIEHAKALIKLSGGSYE